MEEEKKNNKASFGMKFLCFLIPLVGLIIFLSSKKEKPEYAKGCGVAALMGFIVGFVISIIITVVILVVIPGMIITTTGAALESASAYTLSAAEVVTHNAKFTTYEGNETGTKALALVGIIKAHNAAQYDNSSKVSIIVNGTKVDDNAAASKITVMEKYNIKFNYDSNGKINEAIINLDTVSTTNTISNTTTNSTTNTVTYTNSIDTMTNSINTSAGTLVNTLENSAGTLTNSLEGSAGTLTNTLENSMGTLTNSLTDAAGAFSNTLSSFGW